MLKQSQKMSNKAATEDRISALPDDVLIHILSLLDDTREVQKTSILSKRWQHVWTSVQTLAFEYAYDYDDYVYDRNYTNKYREGTPKFVTWVNRTLLACRNANIEKIRVIFESGKCFSSDVDAWFRFASEKEVKELSLQYITLDFGVEDYLNLPDSLCSNYFLMKLSVQGCKFIPEQGLSWARLKSLSISNVEMNEDAITNILLGSPMLEYLNFFSCWGIKQFNINSESLRKLVIDECHDEEEEDESLFEISAPNLQSLYVLGYYYNVQFRMMRVSSILKVKLRVSLDSKDEVDLIELLESLHPVRELELAGRPCMEVLAPLLVRGKTLSSPLTALTCLKVKAFIDKQVVAAIISLLKCSPNLEKLVLKMQPFGAEYPCPKLVEEYWESGRMIERFSLPRLKTVQCYGFKKLADAGEFALTLEQVLRENAEFLDMTP